MAPKISHPDSEVRFYRHPSEEFASDVLFFSEESIDTMMVYDHEFREMQKNLGGKLKETRSHLKELDAERKQALVGTLLSEDCSPFIRSIVEAGLKVIDESATEAEQNRYEQSPAAKIIDALTKQNPNKRYVVPNRSLLNVLEYYKTQHPDPEDYDTPTVTVYKELYEKRVVELVREGILPQNAVGQLMLVQLVTIGFVDSLHAAGVMGRDGIKIRKPHVGTDEEAPIIVHELTHALRYDLHADIFNPNYGVNAEIYRIFDEGTTELMTELILQDEYDSANNNAYPDERNLIIALCELSDGQLTAKDFIDVFFAVDDGAKNVPWLLKNIATIYSPQILGRMRASSNKPKNTKGLTRLQSITTDLYLERARRDELTTDETGIIADRLYDVSSGVLSRKNFLFEDVTDAKSLTSTSS